MELQDNQEFPDVNLFWKTMSDKSYLESTINNVKLTNDWIKVWKPKCHLQRGGLWMWSNKLQKLRSTTMSEYYGCGIVD